jgi:hypothetical protein
VAFVAEGRHQPIDRPGTRGAIPNIHIVSKAKPDGYTWFVLYTRGLLLKFNQSASLLFLVVPQLLLGGVSMYGFQGFEMMT